MQVIRGLHRWQGSGACALTIGNFDGVHLGHQAMLKQLVDLGKARNLPTCVVSFEPLPHEYFSLNAAPARLNGLRDRIDYIRTHGIDYFLLLNFDQALASQPANDFIQQVLIEKLQAKHVLVGDDFRFGHNREGDFALLQTYENKNNFTLERYNTLNIGSERVSSTRVRTLLNNADLKAVKALLGHPYRISGRVVHGEKVGRQLGFPTANVALQHHRPPLRGVFAVVANDLDTGKSYACVANLGERPTVGGRRLLLEVHLLNMDENNLDVDLYGHHLQVDFIEFIRGEQKFDSLDALKNAISNDSDTASSILNSNPEFISLSNRIH